MANNILRPDVGVNDERIYPSGYTQTNGGTAMARSLLRQLEQIRGSETYNAAVADMYTAGVAEPVVSGTLEEDLNVVRSLMKELKGTTNWYGDLENYFDPKDTDVSSTENKDLNLLSLKNNTLDAKTILIAVAEDNTSSGFTVASGTAGVLTASGVITNPTYATDANRCGLPIFGSSSYFDETSGDSVVRVDVLDMSTDSEFEDGGATIWAKMYDGAANGGVGDGVDVYFKFYKGTSPGVECTLSTDDVTSVKFVYPKRKTLADMAEHEWLRTDFVSSWEGDVELIEDITNLWNYTGAADGETAPTWLNTGSHYALDGNPTDLEAASNDINDAIGDRDYVEENYFSSGSTIADALDALDQQVKDNEDAIGSSSAEKYVESVSVDVNKNTPHNTPAAYTPVATVGEEGSNMDVYVNGQLLAADTGAAGANADRDYAETSTSTVTFRFKLHSGMNVTYIIRD